MRESDGRGARAAAMIILAVVAAASLGYGAWPALSGGEVRLPLIGLGVMMGGVAAVLAATARGRT